MGAWQVDIGCAYGPLFGQYLRAALALNTVAHMAATTRAAPAKAA